MKPNAAGLIVAGASNPNWKGGQIAKVCEVCGIGYSVQRPHSKSRFCSLQCVGVSQRGKQQKPRTSVALSCIECGKEFLCIQARLHVTKCCSRGCRTKNHSKKQSGHQNSNWNGGLSRMPYPYNFREISRAIQERDGGRCQSPKCTGIDPRLTAHHINYNKEDCDPSNLITLCSSCNTRANFDRPSWQAFYTDLMVPHRVPEIQTENANERDSRRQADANKRADHEAQVDL
jgi:hypothetical protein